MAVRYMLFSFCCFTFASKILECKNSRRARTKKTTLFLWFCSMFLLAQSKRIEIIVTRKLAGDVSMDHFVQHVIESWICGRLGYGNFIGTGGQGNNGTMSRQNPHHWLWFTKETVHIRQCDIKKTKTSEGKPTDTICYRPQSSLNLSWQKNHYRENLNVVIEKKKWKMGRRDNIRKSQTLSWWITPYVDCSEFLVK